MRNLRIHGLRAQCPSTYLYRPRPAPTALLTLGARCLATKTTSKAAQPGGAPKDVAPSKAQAQAIRTAEEREAALRAARIRRQAQRGDREIQRSQRQEAKREYEARYKSASRKWISSIIALPILLVTSYYLFDRLALGHEPKTIPQEMREQRTV